jgi:hypothetical protein
MRSILGVPLVLEADRSGMGTVGCLKRQTGFRKPGPGLKSYRSSGQTIILTGADHRRARPIG